MKQLDFGSLLRHTEDVTTLLRRLGRGRGDEEPDRSDPMGGDATSRSMVTAL